MCPRTIEVLMNTYCVVQLPEEAKGLVPPEIAQVSVQDTSLSLTLRDAIP